MNFNKLLSKINRRPNSFHKGRVQLRNPQKYMGIGNPTYRSSWEEKVVHYLDLNQRVIRWGGENIIIPYHFALDKSPGNVHRYYTDFYCEVLDKENNIKKFILEVKPKSSLSAPVKPKNPTKKAMKNYLYQLSTYIKNKNKWDATEAYCKAHNITFKKITEQDIVI